MFLHHVTKDLSAYCNAELNPERSRQVAEHLIGCQRCRAQFEEIKLGVRLAEQLPQFAAPDSLWREVEKGLLSQSLEAKPAKNSWQVWQRPAMAMAAVLLVAIIVGVWLYQRESRPFWNVARIDGAPTIGSSKLTESGQLEIGEWLETDATSKARIDVSSIGEVQIDPNTRVRLIQTTPTEHRLELARGKMSAQIWAPPRLFFVNTPSAVAADLGCAYTLEVDEAGGSLLRVTSGWVALELKDRESMVPAGAVCATRPGIGPGTPYFDDASQTFRQALTKIDFEPDNQSWSKIPALDLILLEARPRDTLTLWHLLSRVNGNDRGRLYDRLAVLSAPPAGVTRDGVLRLDEQMLQLWKEKLESSWSNDSAVRKTWIQLWTKALGKIRGVEGRR